MKTENKLSLITRKKIAMDIAIDYCYGKAFFGINQRAKREGVSTSLVANAVLYVKITKPFGDIKKGR